VLISEVQDFKGWVVPVGVRMVKFEVEAGLT
jgi:hypothetical protein